MNERIHRLKLNSVMGIGYQIAAIIVNLILPKFFLQYYGSAVNGLISSLTQFLSFITLCDMGMGAIVSSALYKPLAKKDDQTVSKIVSFARRYFNIIGLILAAYVAVLTVVYPNFVKGQYSWIYIVSLLWSMAISQFGQYFVGINNQILLSADQRSYVQYGINIVTLVLNALFSIIIIRAGGSIQFVKLTTSLIFLLRPIFMDMYVKRNYKLDMTVKTDAGVIPNKCSGIIQHVSYMIYGNTDIVVLTVLSSLTNVSIYSVYTLVNNGVKSLVQALTNGYQALFGNIIAEGDKKLLNRVYDQYEWMLHTLSTLVYSLTAILIVPFVMTYTSGINDADYNVPSFALLITLAYLMNTFREGMYIIIRAAGHYNQTKYAAIIEPVINLAVSIMFVFKFGLVGVAIGTLAATTFFSVYEMLYLSRNILERNLKKFVKQFFVDAIAIFLMFFSTKWIKTNEYTYICWLKSAILSGGICIVVLFGIECAFYNQNMWLLIRKFAKNK